MVDVQEATFTPNADGGDMRATMRAGLREIAVTWPLEGDSELQPMLDRLLARLEQMSFLRTPEGVEIRASLTIAGRTFVSRLPVDSEDHDLKALLDQLMEQIGKNFIETIQSMPAQESRGDQSEDMMYRAGMPSG